MHSNELHNYGEKTKVEGTTKMECARYGFRIDRKTSIGCFTKNGHDMVVIEDIGLDGNLIGFHLSLQSRAKLKCIILRENSANQKVLHAFPYSPPV